MLWHEARFSALTDIGSVRDDEVQGVAREGDVEIRFSP